MNKSAGIIVEWTDKDGNIQKGIARYCDQDRIFKSFKKVLIRLIDEDRNFKRDIDNGKYLVALKHEKVLKTIGFVD